MSYPSANGYTSPTWNPQYGPPQQYMPPQGPQPSSALAIISFIAGIIAFLFGWVPFLGLLLGMAGLILSILAVRKPVLRGLAIAGITLSTLATLTSLVTTGMFMLALLSSGGTTTTVAPESYSPEEFVEIDERALAGIAKEPDAHAGEAMIVYGYVTQFDANTGPCEMRVSVSAEEKSSWFEYEHNSLAFSGDGDNCPELDDIIADDEVKLSVVLHGGQTYSSLGGGTRVPQFEVFEAEVIS